MTTPRTITVLSSSALGLNPPALVTILAREGRGPERLTFEGLGLPHVERETRVRVLSALESCGRGVDRPVHVTVTGHTGGGVARLDLAIAVAVARLLDPSLPGAELDHFVGELSLDGAVRPVRGARVLGFVGGVNFFPADNAAELRTRRQHVPVVLVAHLREALDGTGTPLEAEPLPEVPAPAAIVFPRVRGAAWSHLTATQFARAYRLTLPVVGDTLQNIYSLAGLLPDGGRVVEAPFRAPHHSVSEAGLVGGGDTPRPGEVSLAHEGVLLLDEVTEFRQGPLEALFAAVKVGRVSLVRRGMEVVFPARPRLIVCSGEEGPRLDRLVSAFGLRKVSL